MRASGSAAGAWRSVTASNRERIPPLHLVSDDETLGGAGFAALAERLLRAGGAEVVVQLRAPSAPARPLLALARRLAPVAAAAGARLLVNDRVDVALASGADGVHLGARGMPIPEARRLLGPERWIGASVHSAAEAVAAAREGADYLIAGTLFPTPSHPGRPGSGTEWLTALAGIGVPVIGIGGITPARVGAVRAAGAGGVAVLRGVWQAARPLDALASYLEALKGGFDGG